MKTERFAVKLHRLFVHTVKSLLHYTTSVYIRFPDVHRGQPTELTDRPTFTPIPENHVTSNTTTMRTTLALSMALAANTAAAAATGKAEGFAAGVTGGGDAPDVFPKTTDELIAYLGDDEPRNIVIEGEMNFLGTEGTATESGCAPWGTGATCQTAINHGDWCNREQPDAPKVASITYDKAGVSGIPVKSNKSLVGRGNAVIRGKGLRMSDGVENIILQNFAITELSEYPPRQVSEH